MLGMPSVPRVRLGFRGVILETSVYMGQFVYDFCQKYFSFAYSPTILSSKALRFCSIKYKNLNPSFHSSKATSMEEHAERIGQV